MAGRFSALSASVEAQALRPRPAVRNRGRRGNELASSPGSAGQSRLGLRAVQAVGDDPGLDLEALNRARGQRTVLAIDGEAIALAVQLPLDRPHVGPLLRDQPSTQHAAAVGVVGVAPAAGAVVTAGAGAPDVL